MVLNICLGCMNKLNSEKGNCPYCNFDLNHYEAPDYALKPGTVLNGRYLLGRMLGKGGFGITYIGYDLVLDIKLAIKEYYPQGYVGRDSTKSTKLFWYKTKEDFSKIRACGDNFVKEARIMAKIDDLPALVRIRDVFMENETAYLAMDYIEGITLKEKFSKDGILSYDEIIRYIRPVMRTLAKVHRQGIIHRDISPDNIMLQSNGRSRLLDLGAAKNLNLSSGRKNENKNKAGSAAISSMMVVKKGFSPLEQYGSAGALGPWTDVYALMATTYYLMSGKYLPSPIDRLNPDIERKVETTIENLRMPNKAREGMRKGLAIKSKDRFQNMDELMKYFKDHYSLEEDRRRKAARFKKDNRKAKVRKQNKSGLKNKPVSIKRKEEPGKKKTGRAKNKYLIIAAAALIIALIIGFIYYNNIRNLTSDQTENRSTIGEMLDVKNIAYIPKGDIYTFGTYLQGEDEKDLVIRPALCIDI